MRRVRMGVMLIALLGVASAGAVDYKEYTDDIYDNQNAYSWDTGTIAKGVNIEAKGGTTNKDIVVNVDTVSKVTTVGLDGINILANDEFSASLNFTGTPANAITVEGSITLKGNTSGNIANNKQATLDLGADYTLTVNNSTIVEENSTLTIDGTLTTTNLTVEATRSNDTGRDAKVQVNNGGELTVTTNAVVGEYSDLVINTGGKASFSSIVFDGGSGTINGTMSASSLNIKTGSVVEVSGTASAINGTAPANALSVSGGTLNVNTKGSVNFTTITATAGTILVEDTAAVTAATLQANDESKITVKSGGSITASTSLTAMDSTITLESSSNINIATLNAKGTSNVSIAGTVTDGNKIIASDSAEVQFQTGMTGLLGELGVQNNAKVDINAAVSSNKLTLGSGDINLGNTLTITDTNTTTASGNLNFTSNNAKAVFDRDVVFSGGRIYVGTGVAGAELNITTGGLTIGAGATLDTSAGAFSAKINGDFTLNGTLKVGYATSGVILTDLTGVDELFVGQNATIRMSDDLVRHIATITDLQTDSVQVLKTNTTTDQNWSGTLSWNSGVVTYDYTVRNDGIWVTGSRSIGRDQIRDNMLAQWGAFPQIGEDVGTVLPDDFIDAVIDASFLVRGPAYANLSVSGQFNADVLSSLVNPEAAPYAGYDALMLYNGSGLAMASQVALSSNAKILRYIARRTENLRREIRGNDLVDPDSYAPAPLPASRVWAEALYHVDNAKEAKGFAGYEYYGSGVIVGYDQLFGDLAIGGAASFLGGEYKDHTALAYDSRIDTYGLDLYATLTAPSGWFASLTAGYGYTDNRLRDYRSLNGYGGWNSGDFAGHTLKISASFGRDYWIGDYLTLSPSAGFEYAGSRLEAHRQYFLGDNQTVGADTLAAGEVKNHSSRVPITLAASYNILGDDDSLLTLTGNVGYAYELHDEGASGSIGYEGLGGLVGPVRAVRRDVGRHAFMAGVRGQYYYRQYEFGFGYEYYARRSNHLHSFWLNGGLSF